MARPKIHTDEFIEKEAEALEIWMSKPDNLYLQDFVLSRTYGPQRLPEFAAKNERFSEAYARAKCMQERKLMHGGLTKIYDAQFCKFTMQNVCRWSDKQTVVHEQTANAIPPSAENTSAELVDRSL